MFRTTAIGLSIVVPAGALFSVVMNVLKPPAALTVALFFSGCVASALLGVWLDERLHGQRRTRTRRG